MLAGSFDFAAIGLDDEVRDFAVQGIAYQHELFENFAAVAIGQQWSLTAFERAPVLLLDRGEEIDNIAAGAEAGAVLRIDDGAAAGREHDAFLHRQVIDDLGFALAETVFAFFLKDERYVDTRAGFDFIVTVNERHVQRLRELPPDSGFACPHGTYQEQVLRLLH